MNLLVAIALSAAVIPILPSPARTVQDLYRGPFYMTRDAAFIEPQRGAPLRFSKSVLSRDYALRTIVHSNTIRTVPASAITIRLAFGPTAHGMITFRMRAFERSPEPPLLILPDRTPAFVEFRPIPEDPLPGALALRPDAKVVFTLDSIDSGSGAPLFDNPDATELLWEALGRPAPRASRDGSAPHLTTWSDDSDSSMRLPSRASIAASSGFPARLAWSACIRRPMHRLELRGNSLNSSGVHLRRARQRRQNAQTMSLTGLNRRASTIPRFATEARAISMRERRFTTGCSGGSRAMTITIARRATLRLRR